MLLFLLDLKWALQIINKVQIFVQIYVFDRVKTQSLIIVRVNFVFAFSIWSEIHIIIRSWTFVQLHTFGNIIKKIELGQNYFAYFKNGKLFSIF